MWLEGGLEDHLLWDILKLLNDSRRAGVLSLESDAGKAEIGIRAGLITSARTPTNRDTRAVEEILTKWQHGRFRFECRAANQSENINLPISMAVLEASRQVGEWSEIEKLIPSTASIPKILETPTGENSIHLQQEEWKVLTQIDGRKSIAQIARDLAWSEFETVKVTFRLVLAKLVSIGAPPEPETEAKPRGIFARLRRR